MAALSGDPVPNVKEYNPRTAELTIGSVTLVDAAQIEISGDKGHGQENALGGTGIWVDNVPRVEGTGAVHATSPNIDSLKSLWANSQTFDVTFSPSDDSGESGSALIGCRIQSFSRDAVEIDSMPAISFDFAGFDIR
jgi:hypothetical protein